MLTEEDAETCNFSEVLSKWQNYRSDQSSFTRRCVSAPFSSISGINKRSGQNPAKVEEKTDKTATALCPEAEGQIDRGGHSIDAELQNAPSRKKEVYNHEFKRKHVTKPSGLNPFYKVPDLCYSMKGKSIMRTDLGDARIVETTIAVSIDQTTTLNIDDLQKPSITPFSTSYMSYDGYLFNFDSIVYDLARILALNKFHSVKKRSLELKSLLPDHKYVLKSMCHSDFVYFTSDKAQFTQVTLGRRERLMLRLAAAQGSQVGFKVDKESSDHTLTTDEKDFTAPTVHALLYTLALYYGKSGKLAEFFIAYLCGVHSVLKYSKTTNESHFLRDVLRNFDFAKPFGNMSRIFERNDPSKVFHGLCYERTNHFSPINDVLVSAAFVSVSDPGYAHHRDWQPVYSRARSPAEHLTNISVNSAEFLSIWLRNYCGMYSTKLERDRSELNRTLIGQWQHALNRVNADYLSQKTVCPWFALEPTHILNFSDISLYLKTLPFADATGMPKQSNYHCRANDPENSTKKSVIAIDWVSLRESPLCWIRGQQDTFPLATREYIDVPSVHCLDALPSPLRYFTPEHKTILEVPQFGEFSLENFKTTNHVAMEVVVFPLEEDQLSAEVDRQQSESRDELRDMVSKEKIEQGMQSNTKDPVKVEPKPGASPDPACTGPESDKSPSDEWTDLNIII